MDIRCRIELLGGLCVRQCDRLITRFSTHKTGALLAYLAYYLDRLHPREILIELLWPECDLDAGRARLSVALSSLRHQLEPPGVPAGAVIQADRSSVRLNRTAITTDAVEFEAGLELANRPRSRAEQGQALLHAVELYRGPLLPGYYEDWIFPEQQRLAERYLQALRQLIGHAEHARDLPRALDYARRAVGADPLREEAHQDLMRLYAAVGQPSAALRQYHELERLLNEEMGQAPSAAIRSLAEEIRRSGVQEGPSVATLRRSGAQAEAQRSAPKARHPGPKTQLPPTGTVTFLLSDIEGATALRERWGPSFQAMLTSHHALLRQEFRHHGGAVVKETDDGFLVAFERAGDALACAVTAQQALAAHAWPEPVGLLRVRMALHTGDVQLKEGEYRGLVPDHASRMLLATHGGQILCSEATAGVLRRGGIAAMEAGVRLTDLGIYRLREMQTRERLFQVEYPQMRQGEFPPPRAEAGYASSLPLHFTTFFGRAPELARLRGLLLSDEIRLVTLTGPGGSGKTRLALRVAEQLVEAVRGAVWFVSLADLADPQRIADAARDALRLPPSPQMTSLEQVVDALSSQPALLLLDNFEHLLEAPSPKPGMRHAARPTCGGCPGGAVLVRTLLERVPTLKCLVTSRQPLELEGEHEFLVLPLPTPTGAATPERLCLNESVQLFVDRAQAVRPDFQVTGSNAGAVAELCRRLEGIPLAIELAASRAQVLTPAQMVAQLAHRFDFLVSRRRDAAPRHRSLRAAIDWSYQLLAPELQRFFARLAVFRGGWTLEAAEAVCEEGVGRWASGVGKAESDATPNPQPPMPALDCLAQLRECTLVLAEESAVGMRFRVLETLREFAAEQQAPEERSELERRHAEYFLALAEESEATQRDVEEPEWRHHLEPEQENFRAALAWGLASEPALALRLAGALGPFWGVGGYYTEGREALAQALERGTGGWGQIRAKALRWAGALATRQGDYAQAQELLAESLALSRAQGDRRGIAGALLGLGNVAWPRDDAVTARVLLEESIAIWRELDDKWSLAESLLVLAVALAHLGEPAASTACLEESLELNRQVGNKQGIGWVTNLLGIEATGRGEYATGRALLEEALAVMREIDSPRGTAAVLINLGHVARLQGEYAKARTLLEGSLVKCRRLGERRLVWECLEGLAYVESAQGHTERAARLFGAAAAQREAIGFLRATGSGPWIAAAREALGEARFAAAWDAGRALTWQQAADEALQRHQE